MEVIESKPASETSCRNAHELALQPGIPDLGYGYAPIPCIEGKFTIVDEVIDTTYAVLYRVGDEPLSGSAGTFDGSGDLALDLSY
jgi:hypothetical protein